MKYLFFIFLLIISCDFTDIGYVKKSDVLNIIDNVRSECINELDKHEQYSDNWFYYSGCINKSSAIDFRIRELETSDNSFK